MSYFEKPSKDFVPTLILPEAPRIITGRSFGGGGGGGDEQPNSLKSSQTARIVDLLGEGPIVGPWNGVKSVFYDGVPVQFSDGTDNFQNYSIAGVSGYGNQPVLKGFAAQQNEIGLNVQLKFGLPQTKRISNNFVDRVRVTVSTPSLMKSDDDGNIRGSTIDWKISVQANGGGFNVIHTDTIDGKTNTRYQRQVIFALTGTPPWDVRVERITADSTDLALQNDLYWDSYTEITDVKVNYTLSAVMGHTVRAEDFSSIPKRVYDTGGLLIQYPSNYNPTTRVYSGTWNGTFLTGYCNNPVWVFFDLVVENRYGIGDFIKAADVDIYELYAIAQWCDGNVKTSGSQTETRWTFNGVITDQQEAFDLLANVASVWRGSAFWAGGKLVPSCDKPADPVFLFGNDNVIDGRFTYQSADRSARHNQVAVAWSDQSNLGQRRLTIVEDRNAISKNGIQKTQIVAMGCTSETMAQRVGDWLIYTENYESDTVSFTAGLEGAYVRPGHIVSITDVTVAGSRRSGRLVDITSAVATLDSTVTLKSGMNYYLSACRPDGTVVTVKVSGTRDTPISVLSIGSAIGTPLPNPDSHWALSSDDLQPTQWRVVSAKPSDKDKYDIEAVYHDPNKWNYVERDRKITPPDISNIGNIPAITGTKVTEFMYEISRISVGTKMIVSWDSRAPYFDVAYRLQDGPWTRLMAIAQHSIEVPVEEDVYDIWITPRNSLGKRGKTTKLTYQVIGRSAPPDAVLNFRIQNVSGVALLQWAVSDELDVLIGGSYELRYSPRTDGSATWASSNKIVTSIPGTATTVSVPYRPGTYFIKRMDISGLQSPAASIIATAPKKGVNTFLKIVEDPAWLGTKDRVTVLTPQQWIILSGTNIEGYYTFKNQIDIGGVFDVTLTVDMLAFPYIVGTGFIDDRTDPIDLWQDFDNADSDGEGMVTIQMRQTNQDPTLGTAVWTNWTQFISGDYNGRGFQFRAWLGAPAGQNVGIENLGIIAEVYNKQDQGNDITWVPNSMAITYAVKFYNQPSIAINIQNAATGDYYKVTGKSKTGFTLTLYNASNAVITGARTFDWIASGY